ncbi:unnamed protein product [Ostreobium quekettii]|uniref:Uncharacterized protein n=1 Tax=Ostreobium quekettii TaxID=121088 RepID=A0A8S1J2D0_9CHLO|nr:unnamed protein product [Ostreobium quekettii]
MTYCLECEEALDQCPCNSLQCMLGHCRGLLAMLYSADDRDADVDLLQNAPFDIAFHFLCEVLAAVLMLCLLNCLLDKHKTTCKSGGMDCQRRSEVGKCQPTLSEPDSGASAICGKRSCSNARTVGYTKAQATLAVRLFMALNGIGPALGQAISDTTSAVVKVPQGVLIGSQALYFGLVAAMGKYKLKWRAKTDQRSITFTACVLTVLSIVQIGLLWFSLDRKDNDTLNVIHTTGPAPILSAVVALWLYPVGYESARSKYRRRVALWDSDTGSMVRLRKLLNAWYKLAIYMAVTAVVWAYGLILFLKTDNVYPLFSSVLVPLLSSLIGAIPALSDHIEQIQGKCRGNCQLDVITIPIIGWSRSTSFILLHFDWKAQRMRIERVHSIIDHSNWGNPEHEVIYEVAGNGLMSASEFTGGDFHKRVKDYGKVVRRMGGWHNLSQNTIKMSDQILGALEECPYMHEGHLRVFLFMRSILNTSLKASASRQQMKFDHIQRSVVSMPSFIEDVTMGKVKNGFEIICNDGKVLDAHSADNLVSGFADRIDRDVAAMLLVQMAAISGDNRIYVADTIVDGSDVYLDYSFKTKQWSETTISKNRLLENPNVASRADAGGLYDVFKSSNGLGLSGKSHQERVSADMVPSTLTTFKILRQHMMKYLLGYMGVSIIFIVFGEAFNKSSA